MIRLHMLDDQIIGIFSVQRVLDIVQPFVGKRGVNRIHNGYFLVYNYVRIVGDSVWNTILAFKQIRFSVVHAYVTDIVGNSHR